MSGFQQQVAVQPAQAVSGDFASANPRFAYQSGPFGLVAGAAGVIIGAFAWVTNLSDDADYAAAIVNSFGSGPVSGFVHREQQGTYFNPIGVDSGVSIYAGAPVGSLFTGGDFWVTNSGASAALPGQTIYADLATGKASAGTAVVTVSGGAGSSIAAATGISCTASVVDNIMTVTVVGAGTLVAGALLTGGAAGSIVAQLTPLISGETLGGVGRYALTQSEQSVASTTVTATYGVLTLGSGTAATFPIIGGLLAGANVTGAPYVSQLLTGSSGVTGSTFAVTVSESASAASMTCTKNVATKWFCTNTAAAGELIKMQSQPLG